MFTKHVPTMKGMWKDADCAGYADADGKQWKLPKRNFTSMLKNCPKCGKAVTIRQQWKYNRTWFYIHCKCGMHMKSDLKYRGEDTTGMKEILEKKWNEL